jgi:soluble lytic murein transglycosylase-like protein
VAAATAGAFLALSAGMGTAAAVSVAQLQQEQATLEGQLAAERAQYAQDQAQAAQTLQAIHTLSQQLATAQAAMASTSARLAMVTATLQKTQALLASTQSQYQQTLSRYRVTAQQLVATQRHLAYENQLLSAQLQLMEEHGSIGYLAVVLGAHSFRDFVSRLYLLGQLAAQAAQAVAAVKADEAVLASEKATLAASAQALAARQRDLAMETALVQREQAQVAALKAQQAHQAAVLEAGLAYNRSLESRLAQQERAAEAAMSYLAQEIDRITAQIESLLAQFNGGYLSRRQLYDRLYPLVAPIAARFGLSPALVIAVITEESGGNQAARSVTGAIGLMQLEPGTAAEMGINPYDPYDNVVGGCTYLHQMLGYYHGNLSLALSAYNAGPGAVDSYLAAHPGAQVLPYTAAYVDNILALYHLYLSY